MNVLRRLYERFRVPAEEVRLLNLYRSGAMFMAGFNLATREFGDFVDWAYVKCRYKEHDITFRTDCIFVSNLAGVGSVNYKSSGYAFRQIAKHALKKHRDEAKQIAQNLHNEAALYINDLVNDK